MTNFILLDAAAGAGGFSGIIMIVALFVIFYFFMIRPQQKRQKEIQKFRQGLEKGSRVVTAGGIYGTFKEVRYNCFLIEITDGVRIRVDKGSVYPSADDANQAAAQNGEQK